MLSRNAGFEQPVRDVKHNNDIPLRDEAGRTCGFVCERQGVRYVDKRIDEGRHLHRKINGFGMGDKPLSMALELGAQYAKFHDPQRGTVYFADLLLFRSKGVRINQGYGTQWILPLRYWTKPDSQAAATPTPKPEPEPAILQLALFGEGV